jgi:hypothetical protein
MPVEESEGHPSLEDAIAQATEKLLDNQVSASDEVAEFDIDMEDRLAAARAQLELKPPRVVLPVEAEAVIKLEGLGALVAEYRRAKLVMEAARDELLTAVLEKVG